MSRARSSQRGYTLIELMMAIALFTVAVLGIISMQKITVMSNLHAKNLATAQRIAQAWASQLEMDATQWQTTMPSTGFLNADGTWGRPGYNAARRFGAAFDALGNPLSDSQLDRARFCTHVRMSWLYQNTGASGNGMLRAEIRVFWQRDGETALFSSATMCPTPQTAQQATTIGLSPHLYHFVYQTVGVRQHFQI